MTEDREADAAAETGAEAASADWRYTVSVRSLCEFTAKAGDLDRRYTPTATAVEGLNGQAAVAARRGAGYETEIALQGRHGPLRVRGRADGWDAAGGCLEEVKTLRGHPDVLPANRRELHRAQLETYGALLGRARGLDGIWLALVYFDVTTQTETVWREHRRVDALQEAFESRCRRLLGWAELEAGHRARRDRGLAALAFPPGEFRPGQRRLAEAVWRAAMRRHCLLVQAPTGSGKTLGTLYPLLRAMPAQRIDKVAYLTCKGTARTNGLEALGQLRAGLPGQALRVLAVVSREQGCEHPQNACHGDACPLARGFYDRLPAARAQAVAEGWLDAAAQRRVALSHDICPYYLGQELLRWADVMVGDVHHAFDAHGQIWGLQQALGWRLALLVDEAHNLVERTRRMYSAAVGSAALRAARRVAPSALCGLFDAVLEAAPLAGEVATVPEAFEDAVGALAAGLALHFHGEPLATGPLLAFHFELQRFARLLDQPGDHALFEAVADDREGRAAAGAGAPWPLALPAAADLFEAEPSPCDPIAGGNLRWAVHNVVPARFLRPRFAAWHSVTLFSATLGPPAYPRDLLGLPDDTLWLDLPPAFSAAHLVVRVADGVSTRWPDRQRTQDALTRVMAGQFDGHPGNYLAFFSSFDYLQRVADRLAQQRPDIPQWRQARAMDGAARAAFLARFAPASRGIGFAVLGGVFGEGIDLPGSRLVGAFIATLALPPVSPLNERMRARLAELFDGGHAYADLVPALHKVVQAAGRVLRTPEDRGWLWLMDERYRRPEVRALLPGWWQVGGAEVAA